MANPYYNHGSFPATGSAGASASMRAELDSITAGFNKLPTLTANNVVFVNASGTALEARAGIDAVVIGGTTPAAGTFTTLTLSSALVLPAGSVGAPGAAFAGDTNNGWWAPAADTQAWSLAGAEAMRLNSSGLGLGTTAAGIRLSVASAANVWAQFGASSAAASYMQFLRGGSATIGGYLGFDGGGLLGSGTGTGFVLRSEADLIFMSGATERARIASAGNVTVQPTSSGYPFKVTANGTLAAAFNSNIGGSVLAGISFGSPGSSDLSAGVAGLALSGTTGALILQYVTGGALTEGGRFSSSGHFGIGQNPTFRVDAAETSSGNAVIRMVNLGTGAGAHASLRVESAAAGGDAYAYFIRTGTYDWYAGLDATDNYFKFGTGSVVGTSAALTITPSALGVGVTPTANIDVSVAGTTIRQRLRAGAGFAAILSICGNNTTAEATSFDLQMDSAGAVDIVQRNNSRLSLYTNGTERLRIDAGGTITDQTTGAELGFKGLPSASVTTGAFVAGDRGKCVYATAGVTIPNGVMTATDTVIVQNTTGSAITITKTITTAYNTSTGAALGATFTLGARGRMAIVFNSSSECYVSGNIS